MDVNWIWKVESYPGIYTGILWEKDSDGSIFFVVTYPYRVTKDEGFGRKKEYYMRQDEEILIESDSYWIEDELTKDTSYFSWYLEKNAGFNEILKNDSLKLLLKNFEEIRPLIDKVVIKEML